MKTISIHNLDAQIERLIKERAKSEGVSVNKVIKGILAQAFGIKPADESPRREEFEEFCGIWTARDVKEFDARVGDMGKVDPEDWR